MGIKLIKGNIVDALAKNDIDVLAHGVNCSGGFGSGLAGELARRLPKVKGAYITKYKTEGWGLGQVQLVEAGPGYVMNCATQKLYGRDPRSQPDGMYCSYQAIAVCMQELHDYAQSNELIPAIPYIGCGLAGGDWNKVSKIVEDIFGDMTICVYYLK